MVTELQCSGKVLATDATGVRHESRCRAPRTVTGPLCGFHQYLAERCLGCGGELASVDGDLFCLACGQVVPELPADGRYVEVTSESSSVKYNVWTGDAVSPPHCPCENFQSAPRRPMEVYLCKHLRLVLLKEDAS